MTQTASPVALAAYATEVHFSLCTHCFNTGATDILTWRSVGGETDGYIGGLNLQQTDSATSLPVYYVSVRATNGAGAVSSPMSSNKIKIVQEDEAGKIKIGQEDEAGKIKIGQEDKAGKIKIDTVSFCDK